MNITMYELLGLVKDGKELPKKVKVLDVIYEFDDHYGDYFNKSLDRYLFVYMASEEEWKIAYFLNAQVEILEEEKKFTKEDFIKEAMDLEDITREEFNKRYEVKECNCGRGYCKGFIKVEKVQEEKKIPEKLEDYDFDDSLDANTKCECLRERMQEIENQLDEIIDFLKSKGDE